MHAAFSAYWALGGRWLLETVGAWAVDLLDDSPVVAGAGLLLVAAVKLAGAWAPLLADQGRLPGNRRAWRGLFWAGAGVLVVYGALNTMGAWIGIAIDGFTAARVGHAVLWDPLFLVWGVLLALGLRAGRAGTVREAGS